MRGRKPKPTRLKQLEGNPGKRPINGREPAPRSRARAEPRSGRRDFTGSKERVETMAETTGPDIVYTTVDEAPERGVPLGEEQSRPADPDASLVRCRG